MKKVLSVRIDDVLYTKVNNHDLNKAELISKALNHYFRSKEPNKKIFSEDPTHNKYVGLLEKTIEDNTNHITFLQKEVESLTIMSMAKTPLLARIKMKLLNDKSD